MAKTVGRTAAPAAARGSKGHGVVDLTPPSAAAAAAAQANGSITREGEGGAKKRDAEATPKAPMPVPLWKARDILLEAITGGCAGFFEAHSASSSKRRTRVGSNSTPISRDGGISIIDGADNGSSSDNGACGGDVDHVFSVRLEVQCVFPGLSGSVFCT